MPLRMRHPSVCQTSRVAMSGTSASASVHAWAFPFFRSRSIHPVACYTDRLKDRPIGAASTSSCRRRWESTVCLCRAKKVVDAGLRRHDEAGIAGESIIRTLGIISDPVVLGLRASQVRHRIRTISFRRTLKTTIVSPCLHEVQPWTGKSSGLPCVWIIGQALLVDSDALSRTELSPLNRGGTGAAGLANQLTSVISTDLARLVGKFRTWS
jgi:hypothetical protein